MRSASVLATDNFTIIGIEPIFLRAGNMTVSRSIGVLALPSMLLDHSYAEMKRRIVSGLTVIESDCYGWDGLIDRDLSNHIDLDAAIGEMMRWQADVILIAHSSFSSLKRRIESIAGPSVRVLDAADYT